MPQPPRRPAPLRWLEILAVRQRESHVAFLLRYLKLLLFVVLVFSITFHLMMAVEGQSHGWWVGFYWSLSTMTTLGLGDIVFMSGPGQIFTITVVITGVVFMLVLLPLLLIQFPPWVEARSAARLRRGIRPDIRGHVVLTHLDPITANLIRKLDQYGTPYVLLVAEMDEALRLSDQGYSVVHGELDHPETYRAVGLDRAALMAATSTDVRNSNAVFTARSEAPDVPILATVELAAAVEVLQLAGSTRVLQVHEMLARALARRVLGGDALSHIVGRFDELLIAEANAARTPLVGKKLRETRLRELVTASVVGVWDRGEFQVAGPETEIQPHTVLVLAGTQAELTDYDAVFAIYNVRPEPVLVIGGGRVGRATARALATRGIEYRIVERDPEQCQGDHYIQGDAASLDVLQEAGIARAPSVVITSHDDDTNVFLALYCRRLRPDIQIVSRATYEKNVETLHRAGTDFVLSLASMGAGAIFNLLEGGETVTLTEGLNLFQVKIPRALVGATLTQAELRKRTGCTAVAIRTEEGMIVNPDPTLKLPAESDLVLIGTQASEATFFEHYGESRPKQ